MNEFDAEPERESYPVAPAYHPVHRIRRKIYDFLASSKLAMFLLVLILACCVTGVTVFRGEEAWKKIFSTLWFNSVLVLLVVNVACCFFGRVWHKKITVVSFGMILFHLSFVAMFLAIVYNSLFFFEGTLRLTEGETLPNGDMKSYDKVRQGPFFDYSRLKGETTLVKMHTGYLVDGEDKRAAYEVVVGDGLERKRGIIYITHNLDYKGIKFLPDKEGYSLLTYLSDRNGKDLYGGYISLQSLEQKDGGRFYTTGTKAGPASLQFPQQPLQPVFNIQLAYLPDPKKERAGQAAIQVFPVINNEKEPAPPMVARGEGPIGTSVSAGDYRLRVERVHYWVGMAVRYEPGKPILLASLWVALSGVIITTIGRVIRANRRAFPERKNSAIIKDAVLDN